MRIFHKLLKLARRIDDTPEDMPARWPFTDNQLTYSATARCPCGAGLAHIRNGGRDDHYWDCSDILTNRAIESGQPGARTHTDQLPFVFYEIKSEDQPSARGATTRRRTWNPRQAPGSLL